MSSHRTPAASAASSTAATLFREIRCEAAIARPDRPSARNRSTSLALIFLTIENCSFRRVPFTPGGRSLSRWLRTTITVAPKTANASTGHRLPTPIRVDLSTPNIQRGGRSLCRSDGARGSGRVSVWADQASAPHFAEEPNAARRCIFLSRSRRLPRVPRQDQRVELSRRSLSTQKFES
ncbi:hypothetical protein ACFFX0_32805 [Citricoccus parietis]|uniref:Uncharacterized protein n=1 Tax=Citricoccus parietis TaxID=592307 RepID=A0ABV5G9V0_9MICC